LNSSRYPAACCGWELHFWVFVSFFFSAILASIVILFLEEITFIKKGKNLKTQFL